MATINKVNFVGGTQALFDAVQNKDPNSLYFIHDTQRIYKGNIDVTQSVIPVLNLPEVGVANKIYVHRNTLETYIYADGAWKTIIPGYVTTLDDLNDPRNNSKMATVDAFKQYVDEVLDARTAELINDVTFKADKGNLVFTGAGPESKKKVNLTGVAHDPTYDSEKLRITIPQYGKEDLVIDIPQDNFLADAYYDANYPLDAGAGPAIVLVVKTHGGDDKKIAIPAASMVNDYTAAKSNNIRVSIDDGHVIRATIVIDPETSDGTLMIWDDENQKIGTSGVKIHNNTSVELGESNRYIPTAAVVAAAIKKVSEEITNRILEPGNADEVVISTEHGLVRSGLKIGGEVLSADATVRASTLATEAAVWDAISWKALA